MVFDEDPFEECQKWNQYAKQPLGGVVVTPPFGCNMWETVAFQKASAAKLLEEKGYTVKYKKLAHHPEYVSNYVPRPRVSNSCQKCGKEFVTTLAYSKRAKYCSGNCRALASYYRRKNTKNV